MATYLGLVPNGSQYEETIEGGQIKRRRSVEFYMQATAGERENAVLQSPGVPQRLDPFYWDGELDIMSRCRGVTVVEHDAVNHIWKLRAAYSSQQPESDEHDRPPENRTPTWKWTSETIDHTPTKDAAGKLIAASNGQPLFTTVAATIPVLNISRYRLTFDGQDILDWTNTVNNTAFWGAAQDKALMAAIAANQVDLDGRRLWQVDYTIKFKIGDYAPKGWQLELLDQGTYYINSSGDKIAFTDTQGNPITGNLDGSGDKSSTATYLTFQIYERTEFNDLDLGPW